MRYRHFSVLNGRRLFGILIVLFVFPATFQSCGKLVYRRQNLVQQNVYLNGNDIGGLTKEEALLVITRLVSDNVIPAVDAVVDPETESVIPDLNGLEVDVDTTLQKVLEAERGSEVQPVYRQVPAGVTISSYPYHPVFQGNPEKKQVVFLINVAWGNEYLPEMLNVLQEADAGATFFLVGRWVRGNGEEAVRIKDAGFELANHGDSDALSMARAGYAEVLEDIKKANNTIETVCGVRPSYFSPHRGELTEHVLKAAAEENCRTVMWTVDTVDWKLPGVDVMVEKISTQAGEGSLILMHPTEQTAEFIRQVIPKLRRNGLEPVSLSELLSPLRTEKGVNSP